MPQPLKLGRQASHGKAPWTIEQTQILQALTAVKDPDLHKDIVKLGFVKDLAIDGGTRVVHDRADDARVPGQGTDEGAGAAPP